MHLQKEVTVTIKLTANDIEVLRKIHARWGRAVDDTGIIQHIIHKYDEKTGEDSFDDI